MLNSFNAYYIYLTTNINNLLINKNIIVRLLSGFLSKSFLY